MTNPKWVRVTRKDFCRVCGKPDWCDYSPELGIICCMRSPSAHPMKNGGWRHPMDAKAVEYVPPSRPEPPKINATQIMREWAAETRREMLEQFAIELHVAAEALTALGCAWAWPNKAFAFPMKDGYGNTIGIRLRSQDGRKWAVTGSRSGLFYGIGTADGEMAVTEGPTDTAAAITLGFNVIGRPSCAGQEEMLVIKLKNASRVLIIADGDAVGMSGAQRLQGVLKVPSLIWSPPSKDLRAFVRLGGDRTLIDSLTRSMLWKAK